MVDGEQKVHGMTVQAISLFQTINAVCNRHRDGIYAVFECSIHQAPSISSHDFDGCALLQAFLILNYPPVH